MWTSNYLKPYSAATIGSIDHMVYSALKDARHEMLVKDSEISWVKDHVAPESQVVQSSKLSSQDRKVKSIQAPKTN